MITPKQSFGFIEAVVKNNDYCLQLESPSIEEFSQLRAAIGWDAVDSEVIQLSLKNSLFHVTIRYQSELVAMGRVVGDCAMYFYIQDVVVEPKYQNLGLGTLLMEQIEKYLINAARKGATVGLLAAKGKEEFYARYGYICRPNIALGNGMCKFVT